jgi:NADPH:quinone reductase-like Zn-dependent oxidoreductase
MKKIVIHRPGGYDRLQLESHPDLVPAPQEVLIQVVACGVNFADCVTRMGLYASARHYVGYPITPGFEIAGTVLATGSAVTDLQPGAAVFAVTRFNGYATQVCVPRHQVFLLPESLTLEQAATLPATGLTAWYALSELAQSRSGDRLLVHSAAGGVGSMLVQIGKHYGCHVTGVVGAAHKTAAVLALGADAVIDKSTHALWQEAERLSPQGYDIILDANGVSTLRASYHHLAATGRLVVYGFHSMLVTHRGRPGRWRLALDWLRTPRFSPFDLTTHNRSVAGFNLSFLFDRSDLLQRGIAQLLEWLATGQLHIPPLTRFRFEDVAEAQRALESRQTTGKLVLLVNGNREPG